MRRAVALLLSALLAFGCSAATSPMELAGTYSLMSVNGLPLPYVFTPVGRTKVEALEDSYTLNPSGTFREAGLKRFTTDGVVTFSYPVDGGNFTRKGEEIRLEGIVYGLTIGLMKDGTLTIVQNGLTLVYQK